MIFQRNCNDFDKTVIMNWRVGKNDHQSIRLGEIGDGYLLASRNIVASFNSDEKDGDILIFPALFNMMHGVEVYLKAMIINLEYIVHDRWGDPGNIHWLKDLYKTVEQLIQQHEQDALKELEPVKQIISEIYDQTEQMDFARYPLTSRKKPQFYIDTYKNISVDAEELYKAADICMDILNRMNWHFYEQAQYLEESKTVEG